MAERRLGLRARKRLGCEIRAAARRHFGMVLNVSAEGVYVQSNARLDPGTKVELLLGRDPDRDGFHLRGRIARAFHTPIHLAAVAPGGFGVQLIAPPAAYLAFVSRLLSGSRMPASDPLAGSFGFRVEMKATDGGEARTLIVSCRTESEASELAQAELDEGWKLISVSKL